MSSSSNVIPAFTEVAPSSLIFQPIRTNEGGKGKTVYMDMKTPGAPAGGKPNFSARFLAGPKDMRVAWPLRPKMDIVDPKKMLPGEKFDLELELDAEAHADFIKQAEAYDEHMLRTAFERRVEWFGADKAKHMSSPDFLRMTYKPMLHAGKEKAGGGGGRYPDSIKIKLERCASRVGEFLLETKEIKGKPTQVVKEVVWKPALVDSTPPPGLMEPRFFLCYGQDPKTGVDQYASKVPVFNTAGAILKDAQGKPVMRYVGPEDVKRGCKVHPIFSINKMYVVEGFGPMLTLSQLYIKPVASAQELKVEAANVVDDIDPEITARLLSANFAQDAAAPEGADAQVAAEEAPEDYGAAALEEEALPYAPLTVKLSASPQRSPQRTAAASAAAVPEGLDAPLSVDLSSPKASKKRKHEGDAAPKAPRKTPRIEDDE
jgi:hypothetical protein